MFVSLSPSQKHEEYQHQRYEGGFTTYGPNTHAVGGPQSEWIDRLGADLFCHDCVGLLKVLYAMPTYIIETC